MNKNPLVSIVIPNYNHSAYLDGSISSALNQSYGNIEVIVNDNCSTDNSVGVALKYVSRGAVINKNPVNVQNRNYPLCYERTHGKYFMLLCADDVILPNFIETAVNIMEQNEDVGFVHGERDYMSPEGEKTHLDPFFNRSFKVDGAAMLPIFMLTDIGQSAQAIIRRTSFEQAGCHDTEHDHLNIDREQWFRLAMVSDYAYIRDKCALIRQAHGNSQTSKVVESFYHPIALYLTIKGFVDWGKLRGFADVIDRERAAMSKLARECIGMFEIAMAQENYDLARKYLLFIKLIDRDFAGGSEYSLLAGDLINEQSERYAARRFGETTNFAGHKRSYDPPSGFVPLGDAHNV
jgi:glycosyltransferase involved in cell wall biosynthesis